MSCLLYILSGVLEGRIEEFRVGCLGFFLVWIFFGGNGWIFRRCFMDGRLVGWGIGFFRLSGFVVRVFFSFLYYGLIFIEFIVY